MKDLKDLTLDSFTCLYGGNYYEAMFRLADGIIQGDTSKVTLPAVDGFSSAQVANHLAEKWLTRVHFDIAIHRRQTGVIA